MWVAITAWRDGKLSGLLKNEPFNIPALHGGKMVEVKQRDIFDYLWRQADGRLEGNETGAIIATMQEAEQENELRERRVTTWSRGA